MSSIPEEQQKTLFSAYQKTLERFSLPKSILKGIGSIEDDDNRSKFIHEKFDPILKELKEGEYCILPSILSPHHFTLVLKMKNQSKQMFGVIKNNMFELQAPQGDHIKTNTLEECIERAILSFEMRGAVPILFESHRRQVEANAQKIFKEAIVNNDMEKLDLLFTSAHIKEIEEENLLKIFEVGSKEMIEYILNKLDQKQIRFRDVQPNLGEGEKEKFEKLIFIARKRAAEGDPVNLEIAYRIRQYIKAEHQERFTDKIMQREKNLEDYFKLMSPFSELNIFDPNFKKTRDEYEKKIFAILDRLGDDADKALNIKIGTQNNFSLDIALNKGSPAFMQYCLNKGAMPTVGWKYETLDKFVNNYQSVLRYNLSKNHLSEAEHNDAVQILSNFLKDLDEKRVQEESKKIAAGSMALLQEMIAKEEQSSASRPKK